MPRGQDEPSAPAPSPGPHLTARFSALFSEIQGAVTNSGHGSLLIIM